MRRLIPILALALLFVGCAGKKLDTVITMEPIIASEIQSVQIAVEGQKAGLLSVDCGTVTCYQSLKTIVGQVATYDKALNQALAALNTTSAKLALANMVSVVQDWLNTNLIKLPEKIQPFVLVALQSLSAGLAAANISLGG